MTTTEQKQLTKLEQRRYNELNGYLHEASGERLYHRILQPHVDTFRDCFPDAQEYENGKEFALCWITAEDGEKMAVSSYCQHRKQNGSYGSFTVRVADWVLSRIRENMLIIPNDRLDFQLVDHNNGWTLVIVSHGQIIGSRWLAYIKTETIPTLKEAA